MYKGIGPEAGKQVRETDAFSYACEQCLIGTKEEQDTFLELAKRHTDFLDFAEEFMEWFYSGNWLNDTPRGQKTGWIIRMEDKSLRSFYGTYLEALRSAREEAEKEGCSFVVS